MRHFEYGFSGSTTHVETGFMNSKSKPSELAVKAANLIDRNTEANGEYYVQEAIDQACAERDAEIAELCESCQEQTAISDGFAESIRAKDVELVARRKRIDSLEQAENEWRDALASREAEIVALQEQNRSLRALLERVPHDMVALTDKGISYGWRCADGCPKCAYEKLKL